MGSRWRHPMPIGGAKSIAVQHKPWVRGQKNSVKSVSGSFRLFRRQLGARWLGAKPLKLLLQPISLAAPVARLASLLPGQTPPFALADPSRDAADHEAYGERAEQHQEERRPKRQARFGATERIENEQRRLAIDDGKDDQQYAERKDNKEQNELTPHGGPPLAA
jgi:hypothetical protein